MVREHPEECARVKKEARTWQRGAGRVILDDGRVYWRVRKLTPCRVKCCRARCLERCLSGSGRDGWKRVHSVVHEQVSGNRAGRLLHRRGAGKNVTAFTKCMHLFLVRDTKTMYLMRERATCVPELQTRERTLGRRRNLGLWRYSKTNAVDVRKVAWQYL
jgi:hypothetical protein